MIVVVMVPPPFSSNSIVGKTTTSVGRHVAKPHRDGKRVRGGFIVWGKDVIVPAQAVIRKISVGKNFVWVELPLGAQTYQAKAECLFSTWRCLSRR